MKGRRLPVVNLGTKPEPFVGQITLPTEPGDYCGPVKGYTGDTLAVYYLLPNARDPGMAGEGRVVRHVVSPPHEFREEHDGSLTIRDSIGAATALARVSHRRSVGAEQEQAIRRPARAAG